MALALLLRASSQLKLALLLTGRNRERLDELQNDVDFERTAAEVNVVATVDLTRRLVPAMISRAKETGRRAGLINVSSTLAFQPMPYLATYAASKMFI